MASHKEVVYTFLDQNPEANMKDVRDYVESVMPDMCVATIGYYYNRWHKLNNPNYKLAYWLKNLVDQNPDILENDDVLANALKVYGSNISVAEAKGLVETIKIPSKRLAFSSSQKAKFLKTSVAFTFEEVPENVRYVEEIQFANRNLIMYRL